MFRTHIDRTHVQGQVADENKRGPRVPMIDTVQGLHNWRAYKKDRTGVNSKKNPKDTATKWWDLARNSADPHAQPCGHRDDCKFPHAMCSRVLKDSDAWA